MKKAEKANLGFLDYQGNRDHVVIPVYQVLKVKEANLVCQELVLSGRKEMLAFPVILV